MLSTVVVPERSSSAMPSRADARIDAASWACSSGHTRARNQSITSRSSASPRNSVWHRCTWACTNPGSTSPPDASMTVAAVCLSLGTSAMQPSSTYTDPSTGPPGVRTRPPRTRRSATDDPGLLEEMARLAVDDLLHLVGVDGQHDPVLHEHPTVDDGGAHVGA